MEKVEILLEILKDMKYYQWKQIEWEINHLYGEILNKEVPNSELETLKNNLKSYFN